MYHKKSIQQNSEKVSNFDDCEKSVRGCVIMIQSVVNNAIKQDDRFISFERNILFQDCNDSYGKYSCISLLFKHNKFYLGYAKSVRGGVIMIQSVVNNVIKQDDRFRSFESDILFQDCNNSYSKCASLNSRAS